MICNFVWLWKRQDRGKKRTKLDAVIGESERKSVTKVTNHHELTVRASFHPVSIHQFALRSCPSKDPLSGKERPDPNWKTCKITHSRWWHGLFQARRFQPNLWSRLASAPLVLCFPASSLHYHVVSVSSAASCLVLLTHTKQTYSILNTSLGLLEVSSVWATGGREKSAPSVTTKLTLLWNACGEETTI